MGKFLGEDKQKVLLSWVLGVLCFVIIGLVVAVIVVNVGQNGNGTSDDGSTSEEEVVTEEQMQEWVEQYQEFSALLEKTKNEAENLLKQEPVDISGIHQLYERAINDYIGKEKFAYAWSFVQDESNLLRTAGYDDEALKAMTRIDYSPFPTVLQYEYYMQILALAKELNNTSEIEKFEGLAANTKWAWESVQEATQEYNSQLETELKEAEERDEQYYVENDVEEEGDIE